jgi:hypothetical protein
LLGRQVLFEKNETLASNNKANNPIKIEDQNHHSEDKWKTK